METCFGGEELRFKSCVITVQQSGSNLHYKEVEITRLHQQIRFYISFAFVNVTDVYARGVNVNLTPLTSKRGALATDARGCSLWRSLLERPPPAWESRVRDLLGTRYELGRCGPGRGCYINTIG